MMGQTPYNTAPITQQVHGSIYVLMKVVVMIMTVKYMFNIICNNIVFLNTLLKWWLIISCTFIYLLPWLFGYIANKNYFSILKYSLKGLADYFRHFHISTTVAFWLYNKYLVQMMAKM